MSDLLIDIASKGAIAAMAAQRSVSHNLANVSTTGFKAYIATFTAERSSPDATYRSNLKAVEADMSINFAQGPIITTGNDLDIAVNGKNGWIAVQGKDGEEAYTRAGNLRITAQGQLLNSAGFAVMGNSGPIAIPPAEKVEIGRDGTISIRPIGQSASALAVIDRIRLVSIDPKDLYQGGDSLFRIKEDQLQQTLQADGSIGLIVGALEGSNVNAVEEMVRMISYARKYEAQIKLMNIAKENDTASARIMQV